MSTLSFSSLPSCLSSFFISVLSSVCLHFAKLSNFAVKTWQDTREGDLCLSSLPSVSWFFSWKSRLLLLTERWHKCMLFGLLVWVVGNCGFCFGIWGFLSFTLQLGVYHICREKCKRKQWFLTPLLMDKLNAWSGNLILGERAWRSVIQSCCNMSVFSLF